LFYFSKFKNPSTQTRRNDLLKKSPTKRSLKSLNTSFLKTHQFRIIPL